MTEIDPPFLHQEIGARYLSLSRHALLGDEPGLGKTRQVVMAADLLRAKRLLIICPAVARYNWEREFRRWGDPTLNARRKFRVCLSQEDTPLPDESPIVSYEYATEHRARLTGRFAVLVCDESHFIKAIDSKRARGILLPGGLIHQAVYRWFLSGTPAPNHAAELWPLLYVIKATSTPYDDFVEQFCTTKKFKRQLLIKGTKKAEIPRLRDILAPFLLRRRKVEVMPNLPRITYEDVVVEPQEFDIHGTLFEKYVMFGQDRRSEMVNLITNERVTLETAWKGAKGMEAKVAVLQALSQSVSTLRMWNGMLKVGPTLDIVKEELAHDKRRKLVIFTVHRDVTVHVAQGLDDFGSASLYGGTSAKLRQKNIDNFQTKAGYRVLVCNIQAAGTAITLTAAHHVLFVEQSWVPGENAQAVMRCHRIGQEKSVSVRFLQLVDTLDERIGSVLRRKTAELTQIFDPDLRIAHDRTRIKSTTVNVGQQDDDPYG